MSANSNLNLTSLDFDSLKQNLIVFLQSQDRFKDYDFTGANMNVLLDVLGYNTYLNSFYLNMVASEAFLDSAQLRPSVVSRAKELNYTPRSPRSPMATVNLTFDTSGLKGNLVIPNGTIFIGRNSNDTFSFVTDQTYSILSSGSQYQISNVDVYEGKIFTESFIVDNSIENQKFIFSNRGIDDTSIKITVTTNSGQNVASYSRASSLYGLVSNSYVFFVQESRNQLYEIYFGDGVFGAVPPNGAAITATYRVTRGAAGNGVKSVILAQDLGPVNGGRVTAVTNTVVGSADGSDIEDTEAVRFRAPLHYQTQERAITVPDFRDLIIDQFPEVKDVSVFGGEDISGSVQYGTAFIAVTTTSGAALPDNIKTDVVSFLNSRKSVNIRLQMVDPDYLYIIPDVTLYIEPNSFNSLNEIVTEVQSNIIDWNVANLQRFNETFILSKLASAIDASDSAIKGNSVDLTMYKNVLFANGTPQAVTIPFNNPISPGSISSSSFVLSDGREYEITDFNPTLDTFQGKQQNGKFNLVNTSNTVYFKEVTYNNSQSFIKAGVVNYTAGAIYIQSIDVYNFANPVGITVKATPATTEINGVNQQIVEIDTSATTVRVVVA